MVDATPSHRSIFLYLSPLHRWVPIYLLFVSLSCGTSKPKHASEVVASGLDIVAKGKVDIEGGLIRLAASREGLITSVFVEEGAAVVKGQILATIDDRQARLAHDLALKERLQIGSQLDTMELKLEASKREEARLVALSKHGVITAVDLDLARDRRRQCESELKSLVAAEAAAKTRLDQSRFEVEQRLVRAPLAGRVVKRLARPGDGVSTLNITPLFLFAPDQPFIVRAELDESYVLRVKEGASAEVVLEADETRTAKGIVLRLGHVVGAKSPSEDSTERADSRVVECVLRLETNTFLIGQRVFVRFRQQAKP